MSLREEVDADLAEMRRDLDDPVGTYLGEEYPCLPDGFSQSTTLAIGGDDVEIHGRVRIAVSDLGAVVPVANKLFTFREIDYRIGLVYKSACEGYFCLWLQDPNR